MRLQTKQSDGKENGHASLRTHVLLPRVHIEFEGGAQNTPKNERRFNQNNRANCSKVDREVSNRASSVGPAAEKKSKLVCPKCKGNQNLIRRSHFLYQFNSNRHQAAQLLGLIENCLLDNHNARECAQVACHRYGGRLNSLLPCSPPYAKGG